MRPIYLMQAGALAALLTACGGSGDDAAPLSAPDYRVDLHLPANGTLCSDLDQNGQCGDQEPTLIGSGDQTLTSRQASLLTAPLLFVPAGGGVPLLHPAPMNNAARLVPGMLTSLLQSRIAEGSAPDRALAAFPEFEAALTNLAQTALAAPQPPGHTSLYRALAMQLPALAAQWQQSADLEGALARLQALLALQQPGDLLTVTGVTHFSDGVSALLEQEPADYPGQDASWQQGRMPLSYRKLAADGTPLADDASDWRCVEDLRTHLIWEVKSSDPSSLAWSGRPFVYDDGHYHATADERAEIQLLIDQQLADWQESGVDTRAIEAELRAVVTTGEYVHWLNDKALCGISHWRLPQLGELASLLDFGSLARSDEDEPLTIDTRFFPDLSASLQEFNDGAYWSSTLSVARLLENAPISALGVLFYGEDAGTTITSSIETESFGIEPMHLRLVAEARP